MAKNNYSDVELEKVASLVKRANQRLRQLEKSGLSSISYGYKFLEKEEHDSSNVLSKTAGKLNKTTGQIEGAGKLKFRTDVRKLYKTDRQAFNELVKLAKKFTNAKSSTVKGVKDIYKQTKEYIEETEGHEVEWEEVANTADQAIFNQLIEEYGYSDLMDLVQELSEAYNLDFNQAVMEIYKMKGSSLSSIRRNLKERYSKQYEGKSEEEMLKAIRSESERV